MVTDHGASYMPPTETHLIRSSSVAQIFQVQVMQPMRLKGEAARFPVVYVTEGNRAFDMCKGIAQILQSSGYDAPRFMLVGIGYPGDAPHAGALLRGRDLSFPGYPQFSRVVPEMEGVLMAEPGTKDLAGAVDFQHFIGEELVPFIDGRYETVVGDRTYFGHSLGGGFGLYTLFDRPRLFRRYIISSPGLAFHGETTAQVRYDHYDFLLDHARQFIASGKALDDVRVYMSVGADEQFEPGLESWQLTSNAYRLTALIRAAGIAGLNWQMEVFPGVTHMPAWPLSFIHGVRAVFGSGSSAAQKVRA